MRRNLTAMLAGAGFGPPLKLPCVKQAVAVAILVAGAALVASRGDAALISSSKSFGQLVTNSFIIQSTAYNPNGTPIYQRSFGPEGKLLAGVSSVTITTDTVADTGAVDAMTLTPFSLTPSTRTTQFSTSITVIEVPANYPLPAVTRNISGQWQESITFSGVSGDSPTFASPTATALYPLIELPPWFTMADKVGFTVPSFTLTGMYKVVGPESTTTVPFSMEFEAVAQSANSYIAVQGGAGVGPDFNFIPLETSVVYRPVNPLIFDGVVDGMRFAASFYEMDTAIIFAQNNLVPEPNSLTLGLCCSGMILGSVSNRMRRSR